MDSIPILDKTHYIKRVLNSGLGQTEATEAHLEEWNLDLGQNG
jgi:hypothetical protein